MDMAFEEYDKQKWQELFQRAVLGVIKQGRLNYNAKLGMCEYRAADGLRCSVGHLIEDADYTPEMEGKSVWCHARRGSLPKALAPFHEPLMHLQMIHDRCALAGGVHDFIEKCAAFAERHKIEMPTLPSNNG